MGKFTRISADAFEELQLDAGVLLSTFDPASPVIPDSEDIIATTKGGISISCTPTFEDLAEDVDNAPNGMMEFKKNSGWDCSISFTSLKFNEENFTLAIGSTEKVIGSGYTKIIPRRNLALQDFKTFWCVLDKSNSGAIAVEVKNGLSTSGLSIQSTKNGKGTMQMTITAHVSVDAQDEVPMDFYIIDPDETPSVTLNKSTASVARNATTTLTATTVPAGETVTWASSNTAKATVSNGTVTGVAAGTATITASITVDGQSYTDTCTVTVTEGA